MSEDSGIDKAARQPGNSPPLHEESPEKEAARGTTYRLVIDRFEEDLVVVEVNGGAMLDLPRWMLPSDAAEGDVVLMQQESSEGADLRWTVRIDRAATEAARNTARATLERLKQRDPGGDIAL
jgi:hypothetical protein